MSYLRGLVLLAVVVGPVAGCSAGVPFLPHKALETFRAPPEQRAGERAKGGEFSQGETQSHEDREGLQFEIGQEAHDGDTLYVRGSLRANVRCNTDEVAFKVTTFREGRASSEKLFRLDEVVHSGREGSGGIVGELPLHEPIEATFTIPATEVTDYQIQVLWGSEARLALKGAAPLAPVLRGVVEVRELRAQALEGDCPEQPCVFFTLRGRLLNGVPQPLRQVILGVGFLSGARRSANERGAEGALDEGQSIPENEQRLVINNLDLAPGASQAFRVRMLEAVPTALQGEVTPVVRIVSWEAPQAQGLP